MRPILPAASTAAFFVVAALAASPSPGGTAPADRPESAPGKTSYLYCGHSGNWYPEAPRAGRAVFDVQFLYSSSDHGPTEAQREAVRNAGGQILYEFHFGRIRARIDVSQAGAIGADYLESTADLHDHSLEVLIQIPVPLSDAHRAFLEGVGAIILYEFQIIEGILVRVPDESVPAIRQHPDVVGVELNVIGCDPILGPKKKFEDTKRPYD